MNPIVAGSPQVEPFVTLGGTAETELVGRMCKRDPYAFEEVHNRYRARLYRTAFRILRDPYDAEDALQETLIRAWTKIDTFNGRSSLHTWLTSILVNCALVELRRKRRHPTLSIDENGPCDTSWAESVASSAPEADSLLIEDERTIIVREAMRALRPDLQCILSARNEHSTPFGDIALRLGISLAATKSRAVRAKRICALNVRQALMAKSTAVAS